MFPSLMEGYTALQFVCHTLHCGSVTGTLEKCGFSSGKSNGGEIQDNVGVEAMLTSLKTRLRFLLSLAAAAPVLSTATLCSSARALVERVGERVGTNARPQRCARACNLKRKLFLQILYIYSTFSRTKTISQLFNHSRRVSTGFLGRQEFSQHRTVE